MYALSSRWLQLCVSLAVLSLAATSCSKKENASKPAEKPKPTASAAEAPKPTATAEKPPVDVAKVTAILAKADAFDGNADKVITKCAGCSLHMDGKPEHTLTAHGYKMEFCSQDCADGFGKHLDESILAMKVPEPETGTQPAGD